MLHARTWADVDLGALARNLGRVRALTGDAEIMLVVKADAYGHGAVPVAWHLLSAGARMVGVGDSGEALELRESGVTSPIVILGAVVAGEFEDVVFPMGQAAVPAFGAVIGVGYAQYLDFDAGDPARFALSEPAREWRGLSLIEMARGWLEVEGTRVRGLSRDEIATRALHSTSDFPLILAGVTNKTLRSAYDTAPRTYPAIARRTTVADFKLVHRLQLGEAPQLEKVNQSGEFKRGTIGEAQETYRIETFGKVIGITRQVLINDDLDAFTRVPALFGTSAATLESDVVWGIFTANPAMADGTALFHASHKNLAGTGVALDVAGLAKARTAMAQQRGLDGKTLLNVRPSYLVVPSALELAAEQLLAQNIVPAKAADVVPSSIRSLAVIAEPRLDPASGAVPWFLVASPAAVRCFSLNQSRGGGPGTTAPG